MSWARTQRPTGPHSASRPIRAPLGLMAVSAPITGAVSSTYPISAPKRERVDGPALVEAAEVDVALPLEDRPEHGAHRRTRVPSPTVSARCTYRKSPT